MKISLIIPAYNEEKRLKPFLESIAAYCVTHVNDFAEIIVVDDGSKDTTSTVAGNFKTSIPFLKVIKLAQNQGKGAAVQAGVMAAQGDHVVFMDADGATDITELPKMISALKTSDIAIGNRWIEGSVTERHSILRKLAGWVYRTYLRLFGLGKIDTMCGFKGYQKNIAVELFKNLQEKRWLFDTEIAYKAVRKGYSITNFPILWESKDGSKLSGSDLLKSAWQIWPLIERLKKQPF